jgi:hypothetical protein
VRCKENGVYASEESAPPPNELAIINSVGETLGQRINHPSYQSANVYQITGNILVDNTISTGESYSWNDIASEAYAYAVPDDLDITREYQWVPCSLRLDMFPFEFPFKAGDYARFIDASGTRRRVRMMHVTIDESSATISCGGNQSYETSQDQYKTLGEQNTTNMVNIDEIRRIRDVIGPYEPYLEAEDSHAVGDYFVWQSQLVKCTAAITAGDTIAVGTNVSATDVVSELGSGGSITVDDALSSTSTNPVQNRVINAALDDVNALNFIKAVPNYSGPTDKQSITDYACQQSLAMGGVVGFRATHSSGATGYFGTASFIVIARFSSINYGFGLMLSDSTNSIATFIRRGSPTNNTVYALNKTVYNG